MKDATRFGQWLRGSVLFVLALPFASASYAAEDAGVSEVEEIVVTGSYIKGSAEDAALPIDVITQSDMQVQGDPSLIELVRNLGITSGNLAEENQFQPGGQGNSGVTTINLRGLGSARTLVLVNGRRQVTTQAQGVDVSFMPQMALDRTEILKDGAAALYGSDAIAGVVNLITRHDFEGLEVSGSNQWMEDTNGTQDYSAIYGFQNDRLNFMTAVEFEDRGKLRIRDRDWALLDRPANPAGGWSGIANPASLFPAVFSATPGGAFLPFPTGLLGGSQADTQCANLGGAAFAVSATTGIPGSCGFQYTYFDNIINATESYRSWSELNYEVSDHSTLHFEALYARVQQTVYTSPSYPPQSLFGRDRWIAPTHPGLAQYKLDNPTSGLAVANQGAYAVARAFGSTGWFGDSQKPDVQTNTYRLATSLIGDSFDGAINYDFGVSYSHRERVSETPDTSVERMAFALDGLGGPDCVQGPGAIAGQGGCQYYNPFSNAIQTSVVNGNVNPQFNPNLANSAALTRWLIQRQEYDVVNEQLVFDAVLSGVTPFTLPGGDIGWAAGLQARNDKYDVKLNRIANRDDSPCQFNNPYSVTLNNVTQAQFDACQLGKATGNNLGATGELSFLSAFEEVTTKQNIYGAFSELAVPISDAIDMQLAVRFEDYGGDVGSTLDPKIAVRWQANDWLTVRGSTSTTFRGPPATFLSGRATSLQFVVPTNAFKAVDVVGNEDLKAETAVSTNVGLIATFGGFTASVDYWVYNFSDPFQTESAGQLVNKYSPVSATNPGGLGCQAATATAPAGPGFGTPTCNQISTHIFPLGTVPSGIQRIDTYIINGSDIDTSGVDAFVQYEFETLGGQLALGAEGTYTLEYESEDFVEIGGVVLAPGGDFKGLYNIKTNPFTPIPDLKGNVFARYARDSMSLSYTMRYVADYEDQAPSLPNLAEVDDMITHDVTAIYGWRDFVFSASVFNLTDEDPPQVSADINYDPFTHSAFGRMVKLGVMWSLGD